MVATLEAGLKSGWMCSARRLLICSRGALLRRRGSIAPNCRAFSVKGVPPAVWSNRILLQRQVNF